MNNNDTLLSFLDKAGLTLSPDGHSFNQNDDFESDNCISVLSHYGLLAISGPDAAKFLQGQTTCDLNEINIEKSSLGAYCTPKGRMLTSFLLAQQDNDSYLMRMRRPLVESTKTVLSKYIVFSKAEQHNVNNDYIVVGLYGEKASATINSVFGQTNNDQYQCKVYQGNLAIQIDTQGFMFECWLKTSEIENLWPLLSEGNHLRSSKYWELLTIQLGQGEVSAETVDMFIPQMLNYHVTGAVSFTKGCYTGQEIIARMQYRGKSKRGMYRIKTDSNSLQAGSDLYLATKSDQSIGNIVNVFKTETAGSEALAVITHSAINKASILVGDDNKSVDILPLPYAISRDDI